MDNSAWQISVLTLNKTKTKFLDNLVDEALCKSGGAGPDASISLCEGWLASLTIMVLFIVFTVDYRVLLL